MDVGDAIALGVGEAGLGGEGQIGAQTVGRRQARPLANQHHHHARPNNGADLIAQRDPRARRDHGTIDFDAVGGQSRNEAADQFDRVSVDRGWRQAIADDDREPAWAAVAVRQQML